MPVSVDALILLGAPLLVHLGGSGGGSRLRGSGCSCYLRHSDDAGRIGSGRWIAGVILDVHHREGQ